MRTFIKVVTVLLNLGWIVWMVGMTAQKGVESAGDWWIVALVVATPVLSIASLFLSSRHGRETTDLFGLWLRRKKAEELRRLRELESDSSAQNR